MKKSLIALAVLGSIAGSAAAQSNVTIYGVIDASISRTDTNTTSPVWGLDSGSWSGSRIGFKGSEDLGGGLSAVFQLENGFGVDRGTLGQGNRLFGRQAWVGLKSNAAGTVAFGRQYAPMHLAIDSIDPFETGMGGNSENYIAGTDLPLFVGGSYAGIGSNGDDVRIDNSVSYTTPTIGGFGAQVVYGFGEQTRSFGDNRQIGASAEYAGGPLRVVGALHTAKATTGAFSQKSYVLGGTYDLSVVKLHAAYQRNKVEESGADDFKGRSYLLGASVPFGAGTLRASWVRAKLDDSIDDAKADQWAVGYTHDLSKRTSLYTSYGYIKTEVSGFDDEKSNIFNVGVRHRF